MNEPRISRTQKTAARREINVPARLKRVGLSEAHFIALAAMRVDGGSADASQQIVSQLLHSKAMAQGSCPLADHADAILQDKRQNKKTGGFLFDMILEKFGETKS